MTATAITLAALRQHLDNLEGQIPGYWIDGPYPPTTKGGESNWQAMAYPKGPFDMAGLRHAKNMIGKLKVQYPFVDW